MIHGKIIITYKDGKVSITDFRGTEPIEKAKEKYLHIATEWDYSAQTGNPINYYFCEI